jgi:hypothetical protein
MLLLKHESFQCYLTIKSRMKISCELKERRFGSRVISGGDYPQAGISVRARLKKTFGCSQTKWSQSCQVWACVWKEDSPIQPSWKGMNKIVCIKLFHIPSIINHKILNNIEWGLIKMSPYEPVTVNGQPKLILLSFLETFVSYAYW